MTVHTLQTVQHGREITVALNKLKASPKNARKTPHTAAEVEALAASIAAKGVLQPPVVEPERDGEGRETGWFLVSIGEGRRLALALLAKRKLIAKAMPVRCLLDEDNDAFEISLDENVTRFAMHPADQFEAFKKLADDKGWGADEIAQRFGVTAQLVRQRLRLAVVSPALMAAYRAGDLTLDQLMAFAVSEDHERQDQVFASLSYNRSPGFIRKLMTEHEVEANDPRALYVGGEAYEAEGGYLRRDLFVEDRGGWFEDVVLLDQLAVEKLAAEAEAVRTAEGWLWAEAHLTLPRDHGFKRVYGRAADQDPETRAQLSALGEDYDAILAGCGEDEELSEEASSRLAEIDAALQAVSRPVFDEAVRARSGVFVTLDQEGGVRVERAFRRPQDEPPPPEPYSETPGEVGVTPAARVEDGAKALPERLVADLSAHRTAALRDRLAQEPQAALLVALHSLVLQLFDFYGAEACVDLRATTTELSRFAEGYDDSVAGLSIASRHEGWAGQLPEQAQDLWAALVSLSEAERLALFAHCVSLTVNAVQAVGRSPRALADADGLARYLGLDMRAYWQATAENYFGRVSKAMILDAVREAKSPEDALRLDGLKKDAMAKAAADLLGSEGWLPPLLQDAAAPPA